MNDKDEIAASRYLNAHKGKFIGSMTIEEHIKQAFLDGLFYQQNRQKAKELKAQ